MPEQRGARSPSWFADVFKASCFEALLFKLNLMLWEKMMSLPGFDKAVMSIVKSSEMLSKIIDHFGKQMLVQRWSNAGPREPNQNIKQISLRFNYIQIAFGV